MQSGQGHIIIPASTKNWSSKIVFGTKFDIKTHKKIKIYALQDYSYQYLDINNND